MVNIIEKNQELAADRCNSLNKNIIALGSLQKLSMWDENLCIFFLFVYLDANYCPRSLMQ